MTGEYLNVALGCVCVGGELSSMERVVSDAVASFFLRWEEGG